VGAEINKLPLAQVRKARAMTQERLAEILQVNQAAVSKLEQRADMYMSTLRSYIEAMGGSLEIHAVFPEGEMLLDHPGSEGERQLTSRKAEAIAKGERRQRKTA
jgi:transcriptional regulator with XRE-family HTH domain